MVEPTSPQRKVLFVDDERNVLTGLRRMLRPLRREWDMRFVESGQEALAALEEEPADVLITDMRMPGMGGGKLIMEVKRLYPQTARIVLSGHADEKAMLEAIGATHQFLNKPCDADTLRKTVARTLALREVLHSERLARAVAGMGELPSMPKAYQQLRRALARPDVAIREIAKIVGRDVAMTAKILQLVNSAFFGLGRRIAQVEQAAALLGLETLKTLTLTVQVFSSFKAKKIPGFSLDGLWAHSAQVAALAKRIAKADGLVAREDLERVYMAGLLHDAGKLALAASLPKPFASALRRSRGDGMALCEAELWEVGASHAEVGAYLLGLWGLPDEIVEALTYHHTPSQSPSTDRGVLTYVHVANETISALDAPTKTPTKTPTQSPVDGAPEPMPRLDRAYLERVGLPVDIPTWTAWAHEGEFGGKNDAQAA